MVVWLLFAYTLACELPYLPPSIEYFSPSFEYLNPTTKLSNSDLEQTLYIPGYLEGSGRYLSSSIEWSFTITEASWLRIVAEPKRHTIEISLSSPSNTFSASAGHLSVASIAEKIPKGDYTLKIVVDPINIEKDRNYIDCEYPNMYFNIGIIPFKSLTKLKSKNHSIQFNPLPDLDEMMEDYMEFSETFQSRLINKKFMIK